MNAGQSANRDSADIVIVGGGGIGSAVAYFLTRLAGPGLRVTVCERDPTYAHASTALAAGGVRQQFSTPENVLMSRYGYEFLQTGGAHLAIDGVEPDLGLTPHPYLRLASEEAMPVVLEQVEMQRACGASPETLDRDALSKRFAWMNVEDIGIGVLGGSFEGVFDPFALLQALRRKSIAQGAVYRTGDVVGARCGPNGAVQSLRLGDGSEIACGRVVNAAGPRAALVAALAGLDLPVVALKAHTFAFRAQTPIAGCPIVLDHVQQLNFKPEGALYLAAAPREAELPAPDDFDPDPHMFDRFVWPALAHRVAQFDTLKFQRAWVGHIEWNRFDANPVLGPHPDCPNFIFANGFSGHGAQHIPAAGRAIAELLVHGQYQSLDLSRFGYERLRANAPLRELV